MSGRRRAPAAARSRALMATLATAVAVAVGSCGGTPPTATVGLEGRTEPSAGSPQPVERMAAVVTTGCGSASATIGSAVRLDDEVLLTAAHVVAGAEQVAVVDPADLPANRRWPEFSPAMLFETGVEGAIIAFDPTLDLALITTGDLDRKLADDQLPELAVAAVDTAIVIHGVADREPVDGIVGDRTVIIADEVRGRSRVERDGYRLSASTTDGDSGAGVWSLDGRLVGLVFAVSTADNTRTWALSGREVERFLDDVGGQYNRSFRCDEPSSRLTEQR